MRIPPLPSLAAALVAAPCLLLSPPARADDGHDHAGPAPATAGAATPRFTASSEAFELVGVLQGRRLTLYLDRVADNTPVKGATIVGNGHRVGSKGLGNRQQNHRIHGASGV